MRSLQVTIAELPFRIEIADAALERRVSRIFGTYQTPAGKPIFRIIVEGAYSPDRSSSRDNGPVTVKERPGECIVVQGREDAPSRQLGVIDVRRRICRFSLDGSFHFSLIISVLRTCFLFFLERHDGFFLHAASGIVNGKAYTFTGKSDSGKTTALGNLNPEEVLAEDALAVRMFNSRAGIFAIPFRGDQNACAPAQAVFFPRKFKGVPRLEPETPAEVASELLVNAMFSSPHNSSLVRPVLKTIGRFCRRVPGFNLYFPKSGNLREVIA